MDERFHAPNEGMHGRLRKRLARAVAATALLALAGGCVYSLRPWAVDSAKTSGTALLGEWRDAEDLWIFMQDEDGLRLLLSENGRLGEFRATPFLAAGAEHLDLVPVDSGALGSFFSSHLLPLHGLMRWSVSGDSLFMTTLDLGRAQRVFQQVPPPAEKVDDRWVFTGSSEDVHGYLVAHLSADSLWTDTLRLGK